MYEILVIITQLLESGEEGEQALHTRTNSGMESARAAGSQFRH